MDIVQFIGFIISVFFMGMLFFRPKIDQHRRRNALPEEDLLPQKKDPLKAVVKKNKQTTPTPKKETPFRSSRAHAAPQKMAPSYYAMSTEKKVSKGKNILNRQRKVQDAIVLQELMAPPRVLKNTFMRKEPLKPGNPN